MKEEGQPLDFRYEPHLDLRRTFVDPENERQTYHSYAFFGLKSSIAKRRVLVPIGVEERPGTGEYKGLTVYHVIYGNRRTLASKSLHLSTIPAKVYRNLTEEQRHLMQVAENSTKVKIPAHETAQNLWGYYLFLLSEESKGKYPLEQLQQIPCFWEIPSPAREIVPVSSLGERTGFSSDRVYDAFRYVTLNRRIQEEVEQGKVAYSFALQVARIPDKNRQHVFLSSVLKGRNSEREDRITNKDQLAKAVTQYLKTLEAPLAFDLTPPVTPVRRNNGSLEKHLLEAAGVLGNLSVLLELDPSLAGITAPDVSYKHKGIPYFLSLRAADVSALEARLVDNGTYISIQDRLRKKKEGRSLKDRILAGEMDEERPGGGELFGVVESGKYALVSLSRIVEDLTQPRKTFERSKLEEMAETIRQVGLLQPILVRPYGNKYQIVVGHRRYNACKIAGLSKMDVIIVNVDDRQAREIQYEEDLFEKVILSERADKLYSLYRLEQQKAEREGQRLTLRQFARNYSCLGAETIFNALAFASLPPIVKQMHERGLLHYSTAIAIQEEWSLREEKLGKEVRESWITDRAEECALFNYRAKTLRGKLFAEEKQRTLDGIFNDEQKQRGRRSYLAVQIRDALDFVKAINGSRNKATLEAVAIYLNSYHRLREILSV